ncbi:MAG: hypothetical protein PHR35_06115 [Kiritimatiellae bacterium]|nr:hypothetical protein [Kiritimatiellia bacterium]
MRDTGMYHTVSGTSLPDDTRRLPPLIGNDEIKLCLDARGAMHDFTHQRDSYPPPRITWSGRRHDTRLDRYNGNLFEWGFLDLQFQGESDLPPVTAWRQTLHPREGYVETEITRGAIVERTTSFVHLDRNVIVFHREYENLPSGLERRLRALYTLCQVGATELPFRMTWTPNRPFSKGISADTAADGVRLYRGRITLFSDTACMARHEGNRLELDIVLPESNAVTVCLSLIDDLGDHPQILEIAYDGWMNPHVRAVHRENQSRLGAWRPADFVAQTEAMVVELSTRGYAGLFASHRAAWRDWFSQARVELPSTEPKVRAALDTQLYTMRCNYTRWSSPANPFNTSWSAPYLWDERFPTEGLMRLGILDMPRRTAEWRRTILPFSTLMTSGRGARYVTIAVESGSLISDRNGTCHYEFFAIGVIVNYIYEYCRYQDDDATWCRYYPIFREAAEFFRQWLLVEFPGNNLMVVPLIDVDEGRYPVQDGAFTVCGAARVFQVAADTAERLDIPDPEVPEWRRVGALAWHLADQLCGKLPLLRDGNIPTVDNPATPYIDYELDLHPAPALEIDAAIRDWRTASRRRGDPGSQFQDGKTNATGEAFLLSYWSWGFLSTAHSAAMREEPETALRCLVTSLTTMMDFGALNESSTPDLSDVHHPWFNTTAGAFVRALAVMLVYPRGEDILVLPGIPEAWRDLHFTLPVHGRGQITVKLEDGRLTSVRVRENRTTPVRRLLHLPNRFLDAASAFATGVSIMGKTIGTTVVSVIVEGEAEVLT